MPAIGNIILADAKVTPVNHTFAPVTTDGALARLANRSATIPQGFELLSIELGTPSSGTAAYRVKVKASFPTVAAVEGQDAVTRISSVDCVFNFSQLSTAQDRKDIAKMISGLFAHTTFVTVCENLEPIY